MHKMLASYLNHPFHLTSHDIHRLSDLYCISHLELVLKLNNCYVISYFICVQTCGSSRSSLHGQSAVLKNKQWST